jgi:hypothetical protein
MDPHDSDLYSPSIGLGWLAMLGMFILGFVALTEHVLRCIGSRNAAPRPWSHSPPSPPRAPMAIELKACPFCGNPTPRIVRAGTSRQSTQIECGWCGCRHESADEGDQVGQSWNERSLPSAALQAPLSCLVCGTGTLIPELYTDTFGTVTVVGLERNRCDTCAAGPIMADQIKRNEARLGAAREAHAKSLSSALAQGSPAAALSVDERDQGP